MKYYLTEDSDRNKVFVSLDNIRKVAIYSSTWGTTIEFMYSDSGICSIDIAEKERANLLVEDIYRSLEEPKNETIPF